MAWDRDGSVGFTITGAGTLSQLTQAQMQEFNDEDNVNVYQIDGWNEIGAGSGDVDRYIGVVFPELRSVEAVFITTTGSSNRDPSNFAWSADTTNGQDGTWNALPGPGGPNNCRTQYRTDISLVSGVTAAKGLRYYIEAGGLSSQTEIQAFHIYGRPAAGQAPDRLRLWHPTLDTEVSGAYFDWGDVARSTTEDRDFRVYNPSVLTARGVTLTTEALFNSTPAITSQHTFSMAASPFATTLDIGDIAPGTATGPVTLRRTISSGAELSTWALRIIAAAASYS